MTRLQQPATSLTLIIVSDSDHNTLGFSSEVFPVYSSTASISDCPHIGLVNTTNL
jgi:hypothetical protein